MIIGGVDKFNALRQTMAMVKRGGHQQGEGSDSKRHFVGHRRRVINDLGRSFHIFKCFIGPN